MNQEQSMFNDLRLDVVFFVTFLIHFLVYVISLTFLVQKAKKKRVFFKTTLGKSGQTVSKHKIV